MKFNWDIQEVEFPKGFGKKVADMHGGETHENDSEDPKNFEVADIRAKEPKGRPFVKESKLEKLYTKLVEGFNAQFAAFIAEGNEAAATQLITSLSAARKDLNETIDSLTEYSRLMELASAVDKEECAKCDDGKCTCGDRK